MGGEPGPVMAAVRPRSASCSFWVRPHPPPPRPEHLLGVSIPLQEGRGACSTTPWPQGVTGRGGATIRRQGVWEMPAGPPAADQDLVTWPVTSQVLPSVIHIIRRCIVWPARPVRSHLLTLCRRYGTCRDVRLAGTQRVLVCRKVWGDRRPPFKMADSGKSRSVSPPSRAVPGRCYQGTMG